MTSTTPAHDITVAVPRHWASRKDPEHGIVVAARARALPASGFAPEIVLRTVPVDAELAAWRADALAALSRQLDDFDLEDADEFDLAEQPVAYRRFAHRFGAVDVLCDQWAWVVDGTGVTLTASVARAEYADYCDLFEDVAATVEISGAAPGSGHRGAARW
ncbi:MAG: hypothetical protein NTX33_03925 [Propionibacteriales bacterium]|nr:hypothetical protein [Propionibacteriales bacterium]